MRKYLIGIIIWVLLTVSFSFGAVFAANNGSLGALFAKVSGSWKLMWDEIQDNTVDESELEENSVGSSELQENAIDGTHIADGSIEQDHLASGVFGDADTLDTLDSTDFYKKTDDIKFLQNGWPDSYNKNAYHNVVVDDSLWVKKNLYVDGQITWSVSSPHPERGSDGQIQWTRVVSNRYDVWWGNKNSGYQSVVLNSEKYVLWIRISWKSDDGWLCIANIYDEFIWYTNYRAGLSSNVQWWCNSYYFYLNWSWSGCANDGSHGTFPTRTFIFKDLDEFDNTYYKTSWKSYLAPWRHLRYAQWYNDWWWRHYNQCNIDVLYGTF